METSARTRNAFLTVVGVLAAIVLVAVASRGSTSLGDSAARKPSDALTDILFALYLVALIGGAAMFVYLLVLQRKVKAQTGKAPPRSLRRMLGTMLVLVAVGLLMQRRLSTWQRPAPVEPEEAIGQAQSIPIDTSRQPTAGSLESEVSWCPVLITLGLVLLAVIAYWYAGRARKRARGELHTGLAAAVAQAVDESLDDLRAEPDPRRAVIAAYARLEAVLAAHGLPRKPAEAPMEYLGRMLAELSVSDRAARALTDLFERAKFSQHVVGAEMKDEAIDALRRCGTTWLRRRRSRRRSVRPRSRRSASRRRRKRQAAHLGRFPSSRPGADRHLVFLPGRAEIVVRVYALLLAAFVLAYLLARLRASPPAAHDVARGCSSQPAPAPGPARPQLSGSSARPRSHRLPYLTSHLPPAPHLPLDRDGSPRAPRDRPRRGPEAARRALGDEMW